MMVAEAKMNTLPLNDQLDLTISFDKVFDGLTEDQKEHMYDALLEMNECERVLLNTNHNIISELLRFTEKFEFWKHVPPKDVLDGNSSSQYYYHAHPKSDDKAATKIHDEEHGHFHTFMRLPGILDAETPIDLERTPVEDKKHITHLVGIAMNEMGNITGLFTTNRWVTGGVWYDAKDIIAMAERYGIDHAQPSWVVNKWVSSVFAAFMPVIQELVMKRDQTIVEWESVHSDGAEYNVFEDRRLEATSYCKIDLQSIVRKFS